MPGLITSSANPLVKRIRLLADRKHRRREGAFVVEGIQPVWQAVEAGADLEMLAVAPELLGPGPTEMVERQAAAGVRVARMTPAVFSRLSDRDGPSGLAAIVRTRPLGLADLPAGRDSVFVALHEIGNPGNLGTIIRTASAAGTAGVILLGASTDPFDPASVKASMGALFTVPVVQEPGTTAFLAWAATAGVAVVAASGGAERSFWDASYQRPVAFLLGAEGPGLPPDLLAQAGQQVRIPMAGTAESLNVAVAAALLLYESKRRESPTAQARPGPGVVK